MIELDDMYATVKKLESDTKSRESEVRRLRKYDDRSWGECEKLRFDRLYLWIYESFIGIFSFEDDMMIESDFLIFLDIM
jgi:hypothetical protein